MRKFTTITVSLLSVISFQNCAPKVNFNQEEAATTASRAAGYESFKVSFNRDTAPLDMIWVIDNSGSMNQEAEAVRKNFDAFLTNLNKSTNFRFLLVTSSQRTTNGVAIPPSFDPKTHRQIDVLIGSKDGPAKLLEQIRSIPAGFFRMESKKILVFVTDDNSKLPSGVFLNFLVKSQGWAARDVSISSFIGLGGDVSPCQAETGTEYQSLALMTGGKTYNICSPDWSGDFANLMNNSVSKAVRRFSLTLTSSVQHLTEVRVDGVVLDPGAYSLAGKTVTLADSVTLTPNSLVEVAYR